MNNHKYQNVTESLNKIYQENNSVLDNEISAMQLHAIQEDEW
jgi:hypothetical protein